MLSLAVYQLNQHSLEMAEMENFKLFLSVRKTLLLSLMTGIFGSLLDIAASRDLIFRDIHAYVILYTFQ